MKKNVLYSDKLSRSVVKSITYRLLIIVSTYVVAFLLTGNEELSFGITSISAIINTLLYFVHEQMWNFIRWGKK